MYERAQALAALPAGPKTTAVAAEWLRAAIDDALRVPAPQSQHDYTRTRLYTCDAFEVLALHWRPGAQTPIHDHGGQRCWFALASGTMNVENFRRTDARTAAGYAHLAREGMLELAPGAIDTRENDVELHRCVVPSTGAAITLHLYARPMQRFSIFDFERESCSDVLPSYDADLTA